MLCIETRALGDDFGITADPNCLRCLSISDCVTTKKCGHHFHKQCVENLKKFYTCPNCNPIEEIGQELYFDLVKLKLNEV